MKRVLQYLFQEVKEGRLSRSSAVELAREICTQSVSEKFCGQHPPLHPNVSDLSGQHFSAHLSGEEPYLRLVNGSRVLPDVSHLEMARAAVEAAAIGEEKQVEVQLEQVEWLRPVVVGSEGLDLHVELFAEEEGRTGYEIYSAGEADARVIHSQGWAVAEPSGVDEEVTGGTLLVPRTWQPGAVAAVEVPAESAQSGSEPSVDPHLLAEKTLHRLKGLLGELTKLKVEQIDAREPLESYGIDSIMIMELNRQLGKVFSGLSKTLFFEHPTLSAVAGYLATKHGAACAKWTGLDEQQLPALPAKPAESGRPLARPKRRAVRRRIGSAGEEREPIAIIGISGRYPGARNLEEYWENLKSGKDCIGELLGDRWPLEGFYNPDVGEAAARGQSYSKSGGLLSDFAEFDPLFFNMSPREAADIDPQERLFIQSCWQALEDGGYTREQLKVAHQSRVGVFAGISKTGFALYGPDLWRQGQQAYPHTSFSSAANRVSYLMNLRGPSMPIDTMCSASLTAMHEACEHLYRDECELALAGGVNLYLHPMTYIELCAARMLSKDGRCKSFGKGGNGYVPGEGVGVVLLKRLSQAEADGDQIHALIRGTSVNHGGKTNGYTVPNPVAQKELVRAALARAGVSARSVSYIEAHGTGTELGDPIEITGLTQAFAQDTQDKQFCAIGSVKSNIGHLEAAAGVAGVSKVLLQFKHQQLVPSLHSAELNPHIDFADSPFVVQQQLEAWRRPMVEVDGVSREMPLLAGVSSFGAGGSNAHVVIEEYVPRADASRVSIVVSPSRPALVVLSAKNSDRLKDQVEQLVAAIEQRPLGDTDLLDIAYTLQVGREAMESRLGLIAGSMPELLSKLRDHLAGKSGIEELYQGEVRREKEALSVFAADEELQEAVARWIERGKHGKHGKLLELWVKGWSFDWQRLYGEAKPRRISLPTYPFAKERYWIKPVAGSATAATNGAAIVPHPPLHRNMSDSSGQRFSAHLSGEEPYLRLVNGSRVLPDVVHLELARAAVEAAAGEDSQTEVQLEQIEWLRPVVVGSEGLDLHVELFAEEEGRTGYEIYSAGEAGERVIHSEGWAVAEPSGVASDEPSGTLLMKRIWQPRMVEAAEARAYGQHWVLLCGGEESWARGVEAELKSALPQARCLVVGGGDEAIARRYEAAVLQVVELLQGIVRAKPKGDVLIQAVVGVTGEAGLFGGLSGLLRTARLEHPKLKGQVVALEQAQTAAQIVARLQESARIPDDREVRYCGSERQASSWEELASATGAAEVPWRDGGVYLITGGAGGLGPVFAEDIARRVKDAVIVLVGRSALDEEKQARLKALEELGARVEYHRADVADAAAVTSLVASVRESYGGVSGIIHAAGVIRDSFLLEKTADETGSVLAPKVLGVANLDAATAELTLEFMILFSSGSGSFGNVGQTDYAAANAFLDGYAAHRNVLVSRGERFGRTVSIAWPLWRDGGMKIDAAIVRQQAEAGMQPLETAGGLQALYQALVSDDDGIVVMSGQPTRLRGLFAPPPVPQPSEPAQSGAEPSVDPRLLAEKTLHRLKGLLGELTGLKVEQIDAGEPLESYGIDSVMIMQLNHQLGKVFGELSKTLFFEYPTLSDVAEYLATEHGAACARWTGLDGQQLPVSPAKPVDSGRPLARGKRKAVRRRIGSVGEEREPIAIVGMSGRYPGAQNLEEYWENLKSGKDCVGELPDERWPLEGFYNPDADEAVSHGQSYSKSGGFLSGFAEFDPLFFNISPREAADIDPQERLFIQSCWQALEDGGYTREQLKVAHQGRVGVFAGITKTGFALHGPELWRQGQQAYPHTSFGSVANRVSYLLNLRGPSMPIDTMCSASLTALHEACEHLYRDECELALAGGVNLYLHPMTYIELCAVRMLSKDGRCKSFGKGGDGFVPGEGVGVVLLKRLSQAESDGDQIHAVIRGTSINHGGKTNGYTVPNPVAQKELVRAALVKAGVNARSVSYIEAHGTGTELGDPIEITGLTQAFAQDTQEKQFCAIGSAKSNIGHLEAAAGIAGVSKVVLQLKHQQLVPSLHAEELNPYIDFANSPFVVQQHLEAWRRPVMEVDGVSREMPRLAGVSSFGAGGSNAHVVIEEYVPRADASRASIVVSPSRPALVVLSAKNAERLKDQVEQLVAAIEQRLLGDTDLLDIAYTLQVGREAMESRLGLIAGSMPELLSKLRDHLAGKGGIEELYQGEVRRDKEALSVLAGEDMAPIMDNWIEKGRYGKLLELWVKGLPFDWQRLYGETKPRRISLPTYPFAKERYWIEETEKKTKNESLNGKGKNGALPAVKLNGFDELAYEKLLDRLMDNSLSMAGAVNEATKLLS